MKIIVDAMGGDNAPLEIVRGALQANEKYGVEIILTGRTEAVLRSISECGRKELPKGVEIANATEVVEMSDDPATAFKVKKDSSLTVGLNLLRDGKGDAFVSAGSTGALLSGATLVVKRIRGIRRAAMAPQVPVMGGRAVLCDCGANAECTLEYLVQFAFLGSYYAQHVMGIKRPRVALLNIGAEAEKGDELRRDTFARLQELSGEGRLNFVGNIEGSTAMMGGADVIVADGFSGNVMLKSLEGTGKFLYETMKGMFARSASTKVAAVLMKECINEFKDMLNPSEVGGTPFLGISKPVIKAHGASDALAICNAVRQARDFVQSGFIGDVERDVELMRVEKS
ncbi:phosphate acyltransferase PlsX [Oscillibacter sp. MSJ-2]|uniref:Phosphate acyltransferase n=1 Tax=Dysosmobacter acutus TaxID=2841504 RepID=A0ABS6FCA2_9FIRM|nr:phosphate acyltransferase PlsX [Dysosmobacter acutus]MBU5627915.1 phosphate acyltransferase PlsX [Dysosmobacter acutus]